MAKRASPPELDAEFEEVADKRRADRREASDRRAGRRKFDPLFVATLIANITPPPPPRPGHYSKGRSSPGSRVNLRA